MPASADNPFGVSAFMHGLAKLLFHCHRVEDQGRCASTTAVRHHRRAAYLELGCLHHAHRGVHLSPQDLVVREGSRILLPARNPRPCRWWVPIDRSKRRNVVGQAIDSFERTKTWFSPCRRKRPANVPRRGRPASTTSRARRGSDRSWVYRLRAQGGGTRAAFVPTGDIVADFKVFEEFYAKVTPKYPDPTRPRRHRSRRPRARQRPPDSPTASVMVRA